jgi:hypothetical protein
MTAPYTGGCQCRSVRYVVTTEPNRLLACHCGVRIYHVLKSAQDVLALKPGTLDETSWLRPRSFIWMKSAQGWVPVPDGVEAIE